MAPHGLIVRSLKICGLLVYEVLDLSNEDYFI